MELRRRPPFGAFSRGRGTKNRDAHRPRAATSTAPARPRRRRRAAQRNKRWNLRIRAYPPQRVVERGHARAPCTSTTRGGAAARRDVGHLRRQTGLLHRRHAVAAADDRDAIQTSNASATAKSTLREVVKFKDAHGPFQTTVFDEETTSENSLADSGPTSNPSQPSGCRRRRHS